MVVMLTLSLRYSAIYFSLGTVLVTTAFIGATTTGFLYHNVVFHIGRPLLFIVFAVTSINVYRYIIEEKEKMESLRQQDFIRETFGRYMSDEVVDELLGSPEGLSMRGENREVTFLVSDLRGFTALTENLRPDEVIEIMNRYFEHMVEVIARYRGTVSEFMGDGILAFFGAPLTAEDDPERAVACAIEMQNMLVAVNAKQRKFNLPELAMGIGINTGKVVVGNIGSEKRAKYGVVGMPINVAFRIESFTVGGQILMSPSTYKKVSQVVRISGQEEVSFKGIAKPLFLYNVYAINGSYNVSLLEPKKTPLTPISPPFAVDCFIIEGKSVSRTCINGRITQIGENVAEIILTQKVDPNTSLKIVHKEQRSSGISELYARVLPKEAFANKSTDESVFIKFSTPSHELMKFFY